MHIICVWKGTLDVPALHYVPFVKPALLRLVKIVRRSCRRQVGVEVLRVGDAWLVGVGKRAPHWFRCLCWFLLMARWIDSKAYTHYCPTLDTKRQT